MCGQYVVVESSNDCDRDADPRSKRRAFRGRVEARWGDDIAFEHILFADQATTKLFLGYSGWGSGQLETEIAVGAWDVFNVNLRKLLSGPEELLIGNVEKIREYLSSLENEEEIT